MLSQQDLLIRPDLEGASLSDFHRLREFVEAGYQAAKKALASRKNGSAGSWVESRAPAVTAAAPSIPRDRWTLAMVQVSDAIFIPTERVLKDFPLMVGQTFTIAELTDALTTLRSTGYYKSVWTWPTKAGADVNLIIGVEEGDFRLPPEALTDVLGGLGAQDILIRRRSATALGAVQFSEQSEDKVAADVDFGQSTLERIRNAMLKDPDKGVRSRMVASLGRQRALGRQLATDIESLLATDSDEGVRLASAASLASVALLAARGGGASQKELVIFTRALQAMQALPGAQAAASTLQLALERVKAVDSLRAEVRSGERLRVEGAFVADAKKVGVDLGRLKHAHVNGVVVPVQFDSNENTLRFLDGKGADVLTPGLNTIESGRFWLEERTLTQFVSPYAKSYAIVVAIDDYSRKSDPERRGPTAYAPLGSMIAGARQLRWSLERVGFPESNIIELFDKDATSGAIEALLKEFWLGGKYADADRLLFYFGGHGGSQDGLPFLVTFDHDKTRPTATSFQLNDLLDRQSRLLQQRHVLFAIDACHAGLATRLGPSQLEEEARLRTFQRLALIRRDTEARGRNLIVAGTGAQFALYKNGGIFTKALTAGLEGLADLNGDGVIQFEELVFYVRNRVTAEAAATGVRQDPDGRVLDLFGTGRVVFFRN